MGWRPLECEAAWRGDVQTSAETALGCGRANRRELPASVATCRRPRRSVAPLSLHATVPRRDPSFARFGYSIAISNVSPKSDTHTYRCARRAVQ